MLDFAFANIISDQGNSVITSECIWVQLDIQLDGKAIWPITYTRPTHTSTIVTTEPRHLQGLWPSYKNNVWLFGRSVFNIFKIYWSGELRNIAVILFLKFWEQYGKNNYLVWWQTSSRETLFMKMFKLMFSDTATKCLIPERNIVEEFYRLYITESRQVVCWSLWINLSWPVIETFLYFQIHNTVYDHFLGDLIPII